MKLPAAGGVTSWVPATAIVPLHAPLASHALALDADQVSVVDWPTVSVVGLAPMLTMTGLADAGLAESLPPPPLHAASNTHASAAKNPLPMSARISARRLP